VLITIHKFNCNGCASFMCLNKVSIITIWSFKIPCSIKALWQCSLDLVMVVLFFIVLIEWNVGPTFLSKCTYNGDEGGGDLLLINKKPSYIGKWCSIVSLKTYKKKLHIHSFVMEGQGKTMQNLNSIHNILVFQIDVSIHTSNKKTI